MMQGDWPIWIADSDRIAWSVEKKISRPQAALDKARQIEEDRLKKNKNAKPTAGLTLIVTPKTMDGKAMPTLQEWLEERNHKDAKKK